MLRVPYGVVGAISPFNFPLNLVAHKLGPAIAAGNAVVLKPAGQTPISALKLAEILERGGAARRLAAASSPAPAREVGNAIVEHELTGAISFTGSAAGRLGHPLPRPRTRRSTSSSAPTRR